MIHTHHETFLGRVLLTAENGKLIGLHFDDKPHAPEAELRGERRDDDPLFVAARRQLDVYAAGELREFDLPLGLRGTAFQMQVWLQLIRIPFGQTISYSQLAGRIGAPNSVRAVGTACGANPVGWIVPCHRVVGSNGSLTGYAGGLPRKRQLLDFEAQHGFSLLHAAA